MASITALAPVNVGGRFQQSSGTSLFQVVPSDTVPVGPVSQLIVTVAGTLSLGMWDGTTVAIPVVLGEVLFLAPRLVKTASTATVFASF